MFLLDNGRVSVYEWNGNFVTTLTEGTIFGEMALLMGDFTRHATVRSDRTSANNSIAIAERACNTVTHFGETAAVAHPLRLSLRKAKAAAVPLVHRSERRRCARCTASPCTSCASSSKSTTTAQSQRMRSACYPPARGGALARLAVGQSYTAARRRRLFDFHSSEQIARRNRQTPKEFSPISHTTLRCAAHSALRATVVYE